MPAPAARPAGRVARRARGGFTFAEDPDRDAPSARIIWHADLDPGAIPVEALPADPAHPDSLCLDTLAPWLSSVADSDGCEHVALSNGWHRIRLDIIEGRFAGEKAVLPRFCLEGLASAEFKLLALRRFLALCRYGRFARSLFPPDPGMARAISVLRAHDALTQGASQREIGCALFGAARVGREWNGPSDSLRSRVRRLIREARRMARGDYRLILLKGRRSRRPKC